MNDNKFQPMKNYIYIKNSYFDIKVPVRIISNETNKSSEFLARSFSPLVHNKQRFMEQYENERIRNKSMNRSINLLRE